MQNTRSTPSRGRGVWLPLLVAGLLTLSAVTGLHGQDHNPWSPAVLGQVDTVVISGNTSTLDYVILNEMTMRPGMTATSEILEYDRNRIYSLRLFTRVDLFLDTLGTPHVLHVFVRERWHYFPVPLFGFRDGDPKKPYYGGGFVHNNFQGRNQKLFASVIFGYDPSAQLSFREPLIDHERQLSFSAQTSFSRVRNRSEIEALATGDFNEMHYDVNVTLGKRVALEQSVYLNAGYRMLEVSSYRPLRTVSASGIDRYFYATAGYGYDSRDLGEYASRGRTLGVSVTKFGFGTSAVDFARFGMDVREYVPLTSQLTVAARVTGSFTTGAAIPTYARLYFGYGERIRGYFKHVIEGEHLLGSTVELRFALLPAKVFQLSGTPLPDEFTVWRFGISLVAFADAGRVWFRGEPLALHDFLSGYGGGVRFLLPYSVVARFEYAFNNFGRGEFILDFRTPL